jgi:hypothetical protein
MLEVEGEGGAHVERLPSEIEASARLNARFDWSA